MFMTPEAQAEFDFKGDWIPVEWSDEVIGTQLMASIGAGPNYIRRYLKALNDLRKLTIQTERKSDD